MLDKWDKDFVLISILNWVLQYNLNSNEKESYIAELNTNNFENDLYYTMSNIKHNNSGLLNNYLYTNVDNA